MKLTSLGDLAKLKEAAERRMQIFDNLPDDMKQLANEQGLRKALIKYEQSRDTQRP